MTARLGPFVVSDLERPLGRGGAATVWRGVHEASGLPVALKVLQGRHLRRPEFIASFAAEVRALAGLDHPAIARIYDYGDVSTATAEATHGDLPENAPWLAMALASGGTLGDVAHRPRRWDDVYGLVRVLLEALAHAHARGVLHRDLKPANIVMRTAADSRIGPALGDFGLAARVGDGVPVDLAMAGTPRYAAPEQRLGDWRSFGPWTDLFALGATVWWLVTDLSPGSEETFVPGELPEPNQRSGGVLFDVPEALHPWLARALAVDPSDRFRCAAEAASALPGPRLQQALRWPAQQGPAAAGLRLADLRRPALVGRRAEREALSRLAQTTQPMTVVLDGPSGAGRTALLRWFAEILVEDGKAFEVRIVAGKVHGAVDRLWPWLDPALVDHIRTAGEDAPVAAAALVAALAAQRLVVVTVDDAADQPGAASILWAIRRLGGRIVTVIVGPAPEAFPIADSVVQVENLAESAVADVLQAFLPLTPETALAVASQCGGNLAEARLSLVRLVSAAGVLAADGRFSLPSGFVWPPVDQDAVIDNILAEVPGSLPALGLGVALGRVGVLPSKLHSALLDRGLVVDGVFAVGFRRGVRARIDGAGLTTEVHSRCLEILGSDADPEVLGPHLRRAGRLVEAADQLRRAILELVRGHRHDRVLDAATEFLACDPSLQDAFWARRYRLYSLIHCGNGSACEAEGRELLAEALASDDRVTAADAARSVAVALLRTERLVEARALAGQATVLAEGTALECPCLLLQVDLLLHHDLSTAEALAARALALAEASGKDGLIGEAQEVLASVARRKGDRDAEAKWLLASVAHSSERPAAERAACQVALGDLARHAGRPDHARAHYEAAVANTDTWTEGGETLGAALLNLALLALEAGDANAGRGYLESLADRFIRSASLDPLVDLSTAACAAVLGDFGECEARLSRLWAFSRDHRVLKQPDAAVLLERCSSSAAAADNAAVVAFAEGLTAHIFP